MEQDQDVIQLLQRLQKVPSPSLLEVLQKASNPLHTSSLFELMTLSQNGRYVQLQKMDWNGIWHVSLFVLKFFLQSIFTCSINLSK